MMPVNKFRARKEEILRNNQALWTENEDLKRALSRAFSPAEPVRVHVIPLEWRTSMPPQGGNYAEAAPCSFGEWRIERSEVGAYYHLSGPGFHMRWDDDLDSGKAAIDEYYENIIRRKVISSQSGALSQADGAKCDCPDPVYCNGACEGELGKLAAYFRDEEPSDGFIGDVEGWSPVDTAIHVMRRARSSPSQSGALAHGEAVAWRYWLTNAEVWVLTEDRDEIKRLREAFPDYEIQPLYTYPAPQPSGEPVEWEWWSDLNGGEWVRGRSDDERQMREYDGKRIRDLYAAPQPSGLEPRGCPTPGACSCPQPSGPVVALVKQIDALLAMNKTGQVSHRIPGLAVELLERSKEALSALTSGTPSPAQGTKPSEFRKSRPDLDFSDESQHAAIGMAYTLSAQGPMDGAVECATEGCSQSATVRFERGGVGSHYCYECYLKVQALASAPQPSTRSTSTAGGEDAS